MLTKIVFIIEDFELLNSNVESILSKVDIVRMQSNIIIQTLNHTNVCEFLVYKFKIVK